MDRSGSKPGLRTGELNFQFETVQGAELLLGAGEGPPDSETPTPVTVSTSGQSLGECG